MIPAMISGTIQVVWERRVGSFLHVTSPWQRWPLHKPLPASLVVLQEVYVNGLFPSSQQIGDGAVHVTIDLNNYKWPNPFSQKLGLHDMGIGMWGIEIPDQVPRHK